jgi:uncharacterized membrane protein
MTMPLACTNAIVALPVFAPVLLVILVIAVHYVRERRHWNDEDGAPDLS